MEDQDLIFCRCEEVTQNEIMGAIKEGAQSLNDIKRMTRTGKGLCQGRTCQKLVGQLLQKSGRGLDEIFPKPPTFRPPLRPITLEELAGGELK